ncbi:Leucine-rich repeat-containing protein 71 [Clonorchis sinensis]|uniref:Leucine-rich repeat-containing protein 71 n=1 Tax=Clonorchis sinensis TaxID=79923 RepID=A0A8T1M4V3_CLOSI|nr:Leucine-rich repeat-containing protein 71 [Clonorchis sinensis]
MVKKTGTLSQRSTDRSENTQNTFNEGEGISLTGKDFESPEMTGRFEEDYQMMCLKKGLQNFPIVERLGLANAPESKRLKSSKSGSSVNSTRENSQTNYDVLTTSEVAPTTFNTGSEEIFTPKIQIQVEVPDKTETVTEVYMRGWSMTDVTLEVILNCCSVTSKLHTLNFWSAGLTAEQVAQLARFLATNTHVRCLAIDANDALNEDSFASLIQDEGSLEQLRLRHCRLGPAEAKQIATRLGTTKSANTTLLRLDLSGNRIGDTGAVYIAQALRTNRTLNMLSLSDNDIHDTGANALAEVVSQYFLTHEEVVQRRMLQSARQQIQPQPVPQGPTTGKRSKRSSPIADTKEASEKVQEQGSRHRVSKQIEGTEKEDKRGSKLRRPEQTTTKKDTRRTSGRMGASRTVRSGRETPESSQAELILPKTPRPDSADSTHPLMGKATYIEPHGLQVVGNFVLAFLNLSRNRISEIGLASFLKAMEFQAEHVRSDANCSGLGLLKLLLRGNSFDDQCPQFTRLMDIVEPRDPLNRLTAATDRDSTPTDRQSSK